MPPFTVLLFLAGATLIVVAIFGGGLTIKEVEVPKLGPIPRTLVAIFGLFLMFGPIFETNWFLRLMDPKVADPDSEAVKKAPTGVPAVIPAVDSPPSVHVNSPIPGPPNPNPPPPPSVNPNPLPAPGMVNFRDDLGPHQESETAYLYIDNKRAGTILLNATNTHAIISVPATEKVETYEINGISTQTNTSAKPEIIKGAGSLLLRQGIVYFLHIPPGPNIPGHDPSYYWFSTADLLSNKIEALRAAKPTLFEEGVLDRKRFEGWFGTLSDDSLAGATYWVTHRSLQSPGTCGGEGSSSTGPDWTEGCENARARLTQSERMRLARPEYKAGWNSVVTGSRS